MIAERAASMLRCYEDEAVLSSRMMMLLIKKKNQVKSNLVELACASCKLLRLP